jgi:hypothetical protein
LRSVNLHAPDYRFLDRWMRLTFIWQSQSVVLVKNDVFDACYGLKLVKVQISHTLDS